MFKIFWNRGVVPIGEVGDEVEKSVAQFLLSFSLFGILLKTYESLYTLADSAASGIPCPSRHLICEPPCESSLGNAGLLDRARERHK